MAAVKRLNHYDCYGGWRGLKGSETGFFHVEEMDGVWWLVDPDGYVFISKGVNHVDHRGDFCPALGYSPYERNVTAKYGGVEAWVDVTVKRLKEWGFNTVGSWSSPELFGRMPYTLILDILASFGFSWLTGKVPDIFSEEFEQHARKRAIEFCSQRKKDPYLIGYFTDNELRWGPDWRSPNHLLDDFMKLPAGSPGKRIAVDTVKEVFGNDVALLDEVLGADFDSFDRLLDYTGKLPDHPLIAEARSRFLRRYAERYFSVCYDAVKRADPNHMILGCRFAVAPPREVLKTVRDYVDVVSINNYSLTAPTGMLRHVYEVTGKPMMVTEFSFKAMDSGLPNTKGAGTPLKTQRERAEHCKRYVDTLLTLPFILGYHWFQYMDQPKEGRFDGENSNFGLVKIDDEPYRLLVETFKQINFNAEKTHLSKV